MKLIPKSTLHYVAYLTFCHTLSIHVNKFILSVLRFTYPTVFQGWQTFVAVIIMRILMFENLSAVVCLKSFCSHLPLFLSFVGAIVAGSKALSYLPIPIIVAVSNLLPALNHILTTCRSDATNYFLFSNSILCVVSVLAIFFSDHNLSSFSVAALWLYTHLLFGASQDIFNNEDTSTRFSSFDKLFYCNLFSVVVLAPSSLYLEEAFEALHFQERSQLSFLFGCVLSGVSGTLGSVLSLHSASESLNVNAISKVLLCLFSPMILPCSLSYFTWLLIYIILITSCFIPHSATEVMDCSRPKQLEHV
ncbi:transmembrane protein 241-like [Thrips palmi]|uniref:Transmembrane protein 241-like n=1 Tax=Thrips palmi TaxID=161013 RepID=A0A6P8ZW54_THRPL|nr:transmembrane protein 241-like [Thrips palmi]